MGVKVRFWKGAWWVFVHHGKRRKAKRIGDKETAERVARAIRERLARGDFKLPAASEAVTLRSYAKSWLKAASGNLKASTVAFYEGNLDRHILPALGDRLVSSIRREDCRELIAAARGKGLKLATVRGIVRTLSTVLTEAVEDGHLEGNPAVRLRKYLRRGDEPEPEIQPLTQAEVGQVLGVARQSFPRWYPLLLCAVRTGMRQGELLGLDWGDVDFAGRFLTVRRNLVRGLLTTPKNHQRRQVDMSAQLAFELEDLRRRERARWLKEGKSLPDPVFASEAGTRLDEANVRHLFRRILTKAGMRLIRFHDLRHTYASLLIQQGESLAYVKEQMGHKSIQITVDTYGHLVPGGNRAAVDRLDDEPVAQPNATQTQPEDPDRIEKVKKSAGEPRRNRTYNPQIKSLLLCQLS